MGRLEGTRQLHTDPHDLAPRLRATRGHGVSERATGEVRHDEVWRAFDRYADIDDGDDVRMPRERAHRERFP